MYTFRSVGDKARLQLHRGCHRRIMELLRLLRIAPDDATRERIEQRIRQYQRVENRIGILLYG